jgi:glycosyltransferase involved in cell wall biosynthesis
MSIIEEFINNCPLQTNLRDNELFRQIENYANSLHPDKLDQLDQLLAESLLSTYSAVLAIKLAKSKFFLKQLNKDVHVTFLFAIYKETDRLSFSYESALGEDCLNEKIRQIEWLVSNTSKVTWDLIIVDDGCPNGSGIKAQEIANKSAYRDQIKVLFLQEAIDSNSKLAGWLNSTADSQKGGAILYGLRYASSLKRKNNIILYTDADLSSHLGMSGLLIEALVNQNKSLAIGSRREKTSFTLRSDFRDNRGKLFIYLRRRLLHPINYISDEQCGFKAFDALFLDNFLEDVIETKFSFDVELLLRTELKKPNSIAQIPIAWMDSDEASTTKTLEPYLPMLNRMVDFYEHYLPFNPEAENFKSFIRDLTEEAWDHLIHNIPMAIKTWDPIKDVQFNKVSTDQLKLSAKLF